jgi:NAD(P)H-hydrate epimerase
VTAPTAELAARFGSLTAAELGRLDAAAGAAGVDVLQLMEVAGFQVARAAWTALGDKPGAVCVVAGRGNNGGDAMVAARHLDAWGCRVACVAVASDDAPVRGAAVMQLAALRGIEVEVAVTMDINVVRTHARESALALDGLLGTGLRDAPREHDAAVIDALNGSGLPILAIDVPSGLDATDGRMPGACIRAAGTVTLTAMKAGLWTGSGRVQAGDVLVADIGMPAAAWRAAGLERPRDVVAGALLPVPATT